MTSSPIQRQPVRQLALRVLRRVETSADFADQLITALAAAQGLTPQGRAFLRELTYGVLRWRNRLDWMLQQCSDHLLEIVDPRCSQPAPVRCVPALLHGSPATLCCRQ